jgi:hypothetical protein
LHPDPINGWDCWGLGYLDGDEKKVGCLLHPSQHDGTDYRYLVEYEGKCAREMCLEAKTFDALSEKAKRFYLDMTTGMDSFEYSSREWNPIYPVLLFGGVVSEEIAGSEGFRSMRRDEFTKRYDAFLTPISHKTDGYLVEKVVEVMGASCLREPGFLEAYKRWQERLVEQYRIDDASSPLTPGANHSNRPVHVYDIPLSFSRFLKFGLNIWSASEERVASLKKEIDGEIDQFIP